MAAILTPAIALMNRLRLRSKFLLIIFLCMAPLLTLSYITWSNIEANTSFTKQELRGIEFIMTLQKLMINMAETRGMTNSYLLGDTSFKEKIETKRLEVNTVIASLLNIENHFTKQIANENRGTIILKEWKALQKQAFNQEADKTFWAHTDLITKVTQYITYIGHTYNLVLDSKIDRSSLANAIITQIPNLVESIGQLRGLGAGAAETGLLDTDKKLRMAVLLDRIGTNRQLLQTAISNAISANPSLKKPLNSAYQKAIEGTARFILVTHQKIMQSTHIDIDTNEYFNAGSNGIHSSLELYDLLIPILNESLKQQLVQYRNTNIFTMAVIVMTLLLLSYLFMGFYAAIKQSLDRLHHSALNIAEGNLTERLKLGTHDEMAQIGTAINTIAEGVSQAISSVITTSNQLVNVADHLVNSSQNIEEDSAQTMALASEIQSLLKRFHIDLDALEKFNAENKHTLFHWDNSFSVGIKEIDRQHKTLVNMVNELYHEVKTGSDLLLLERILQGLIDYTITHFTYEERLMERHGYEELDVHKLKHKKLAKQVLDFQRRVKTNEDGIVDELLEFLNNWLFNHIKGADKQYGIALNSKGVS